MINIRIKLKGCIMNAYEKINNFMRNENLNKHQFGMLMGYEIECASAIVSSILKRKSKSPSMKTCVRIQNATNGQVNLYDFALCCTKDQSYFRMISEYIKRKFFCEDEKISIHNIENLSYCIVRVNENGIEHKHIVNNNKIDRILSIIEE
jgi:hypothetical protein